MAADRATFSDEEVGERIRAAMDHDWVAEVPQALIRDVVRCFGGDSLGLLIPPTASDLSQLRAMAAGSVMGGLLVDHAEDVAERGLSGQQAIDAVVRGTLEERGDRCVRHIQEIYQRESNDGRARRVVNRVSPAISSAIDSLTRNIVQSARPARTPIARSTGLDDGVPLQ
jgi:hypothetical protein